MSTCRYCGGEKELSVLELWREERAFLLSTCCEEYHEAMLDELADPELQRDPNWFRGFREWLLDETGLDARTVYVSSDGMIRLDYGLELRPIKLNDAKEFVARHHRHNKPPCGWRWGHAVYNGDDLVGVAMVGRPVARMLDASRVVEVNRVCIDPTLDSGLVWCAASMLYGAAAREAKARGFEKVITYTLEHELGTTLRAAGWSVETTTKGGSWNRPSRARTDSAPTCRKFRWARALTKRARRELRKAA
jgi:hypothetical protein